MTKERSQRFTVISNTVAEINEKSLREQQDSQEYSNSDYQTNPMYEKLLNFRNLQETQKKRFSVDDLFKLC